MKKTICVLLLLCIVLTAAGCAQACKTENAKIDLGESALYSVEDRQAAVDYIVNRLFKNNVVKELYAVRYAGDDRSQEEQAYYVDAEQLAFDEIIVFLTDFRSARGVKAGSLNPNENYTDYAYILGRETGGDWEFVTGGYG
ncbi:MAG: hypothetical protein IJK64_03635 [Clostridia bacterium]|nr:hypothetical protein [Clostridia bacterium]